MAAAHDYLARHHALDRAQKKKLKSGTFFGIELVDSVTRLCAMNLLLHGIGGESGDGADSDMPVVTKDALAGKHGEYEIVLATAKRGSAFTTRSLTAEPAEKRDNHALRQEEQRDHRQRGRRVVQGIADINRDDFWACTSNNQLNFLQHIFTILKQHGRAAVVLPDNVLTPSLPLSRPLGLCSAQSISLASRRLGSSKAARATALREAWTTRRSHFAGRRKRQTIRRELLKQADVHTLLRLPTGIFYPQGVKANVLFFDRKPAQEKPHTTKLWIYDLRTNLHFTLKENTLKRTDLNDFVACYHPNKQAWTTKRSSGSKTTPSETALNSPIPTPTRWRSPQISKLGWSSTRPSRFTTHMRNSRTQREVLVRGFLIDYDAFVNGDRRDGSGLGEMWNANDYPDRFTVAERFGMKLDIVPVPDKKHFLVTIGREELLELQRGVDARIAAAEVKVRADLFRQLSARRSARWRKSWPATAS